MEKNDQQPSISGENEAREAWVKPEIVSFKPVEAAEGISYRRGDGLTNLT